MNSKTSFKVTDQFEKEAFSRFVYENPNTVDLYMRTQIRAYFLTKSKEEL